MKYEEAIKRIEYLKNKAEIALNNNNTSCEWLKKDVEGTITAFSMAIDALQKQATSEWIPCSEKMPPKPEENPSFDNKPLEMYLISIDALDYPFRAFWNGKFFTDGFARCKAIAWQPLPEPYEENE